MNAATLQRYSLLAVIGCWVIAYSSQLHYDTWRRYGEAKIPATYNEFIEPQPLSAETARIASFGAAEFTANLYWLQLIQYYGGGDPYGKYRKLAELFQTVTDLSPRFEHAYVTGLIILPGEGFVDEAIALGEKGQQVLGDSWEVPYYTGLVYHIYKKDYAKAGEAFTKAAAFADAPPLTKLFAGIYFKEADQRKKAYLIFQTIIATSDNDFVVERAERYIVHLDGIFTLENAVAKFRETFGRLPESLDELVSRGTLNSLPVSPLSITYTYDPSTGAVGEAKL